MLKNDNGVSLITVIITIVTMVILIAIVINSSLSSVEETNITKINNEIKSLKEGVSIRITNNERNESLYPLVGKKLKDSEILEKLNSIEKLSSGEAIRLAEKYNDNTKDYFRLIGREDAKILGIEGIDIEHYYIVNYYDCEVYGPVDINLVNSGG